MGKIKYLFIISLFVACGNKYDPGKIQGDWRFTNGDFKNLEIHIDSSTFIYFDKERRDTFHYKLNDTHLTLVDPNGKSMVYEIKKLTSTELEFGRPNGHTAKLKRK